MIAGLFTAFLLLAQPAADAPAPPCDANLQVCPVIDPATGLPRVWPVDIQGFQDDVETCVHFAGEEPYDAARRRQIEAAIRRHCDGSARALPRLLKRYEKAPDALARIRAIQAFREASL
ncbi:hypothetical protein [Caulobacter sp. NIBR1757]|uniref:hypothetical protein n=1 Tax=Caulobacter sp. NIBR1757 TaxID=3016000 RepID=UPI0022F06000|nr:hypothetical protein [Caulobacter sp. NIBR1757]WGM39103.1 hypothetical protein AMEJIAPC_02016 [Caulobacter sp. NIBR1757]